MDFSKDDLYVMNEVKTQTKTNYNFQKKCGKNEMVFHIFSQLL